ncbi:SDR family NAD(P)-dependent oxidoreductase [Pedobacter sp. PLR]|uniref:SDR family NAD(P)-dependent oxidoreductase n=1 Tax=Pedobacter sp. PLR TaxID=2994465 RepID=UPI002246D6C8|nr:SDR family NAD(P)-dependent oxidoreductase [Pedobacter sp. PLR]MCX2450154.1 SDR family NAD(P)-dependent oxidoreductase [Pedobacter sp. PLR]
MKRLQGKKALVTGSSRGIGKAIALQLAMEGAEVLIHYRVNQQEAQQVADEISAFGGRSHILQADLSDADQAIKLAGDAWEKLNGIDFLVNNAGVSYKKHFLDTTQEDVDHFTNINFKGTLFLTQTVAKLMVSRQTEGSIYTVTSINAIQPGVGLSVYGATKAALETLMKGVALELAPHQIKVNTIAVGAIETDMNAAVWQDPEKLKMVNDHIPLGRLGRPQEVAVMIADLLASGSYMTGTTIKIDGGWQLQQGFVKSQSYTTS